MHFYAQVWVDSLDDVEARVEKAMEPYRQDDGDGYGLWDWYEIGGRWTRGDGLDDVIRVEDCPPNRRCATLIVREHVLHGERGELDDDGLAVAPALATLGVRSGYLVTVDYHA